MAGSSKFSYVLHEKVRPLFILNIQVSASMEDPSDSSIIEEAEKHLPVHFLYIVHNFIDLYILSSIISPSAIEGVGQKWVAAQKVAETMEKEIVDSQ